MQQELEARGKIKLGTLPSDTRQALSRLSGNWLEFMPEDDSIVVRHVQPIGCPALSAIPCELLSMIGSIPFKQRDVMPGGAFYLKDRKGETTRVVVEKGEVRIQWPHPDYNHASPISLEEAMKDLNPANAMINGWARFAGPKSAIDKLQDCLDQFEGLYPEGDLLSEFHKEKVSVKFEKVNVGPRVLLAKLKEVTSLPESLQAELNVSSFITEATALDFRIHVKNGKVEAEHPALWRED